MFLCFAVLLLFSVSLSHCEEGGAARTGSVDSRPSTSTADLPQETPTPERDTAENDVDFDEDIESESEEGSTDDEEQEERESDSDHEDGSQNRLITDFNYEDYITGPTASWISPQPLDNLISDHPNNGRPEGKPDLIGCLARERKFQDTDHSAFELEIRRRISKLTARYQRLRSHKPLVKHQLKNKLSILRRILGNVGQDPSVAEEGELDTRRPISLRFIRALNNVAGETSTVLGYLLAFGYLPKVMKLTENRLKNLDNWDEEATPCQLEEAIGEFQRFNGLPVTKKLDFPTIRKLRKARCGMRDIPARRSKRKGKWGEKRKSSRSKRYVLRKRGWRTGSPARELTYYVKNCTNTLPLDVCKNEIREGIKRWTEVAPIFFREVGESEAASADFTIYFVSGEHPKKNQSSPKNDDPFDGPGGVVGHAYFPRGGHIHFDNSETYSWNSDRGINLRYFTVHEIGHALGLEHSDVAETVMIPVYDVEKRGWAGSDKLYQDDIQGIRKKYGKGRGYVKSLKAG